MLPPHANSTFITLLLWVINILDLILPFRTLSAIKNELSDGWCKIATLYRNRSPGRSSFHLVSCTILVSYSPVYTYSHFFAGGFGIKYKGSFNSPPQMLEFQAPGSIRLIRPRILPFC
ncbi:hypothetical protein P3S67_012790 [Capsicum chacoense]